MPKTIQDLRNEAKQAELDKLDNWQDEAVSMLIENDIAHKRSEAPYVLLDGTYRVRLDYYDSATNWYWTCDLYWPDGKPLGSYEFYNGDPNSAKAALLKLCDAIDQHIADSGPAATEEAILLNAVDLDTVEAWRQRRGLNEEEFFAKDKALRDMLNERRRLAEDKFRETRT